MVAAANMSRACDLCQEIYFRPPSAIGRFCSSRCEGLNKRRPLEERFWAKVQKSAGCWLWTGKRNDQGYGIIHSSGTYQALRAHRVSWVIHFGPIPDDLVICHACDVRHCVRPDHLALGLQVDNMEDMATKGRHFSKTKPALVAHGQGHGMSRLTDDQVREMRRRYEAKEANQYQLADQYGIRQSTVWSIVRGKSWRHVT